MPKKQKKAKTKLKTSFLRLRLADSHHAEIKTAAEKAGITVSAWAVERLLRCARQEVGT